MLYCPCSQTISHPQHQSYYPNSSCLLNFCLYSTTSTCIQYEIPLHKQNFITSKKNVKYHPILIPLGNILFCLLRTYSIDDFSINPFSSPGTPSHLLHLLEYKKNQLHYTHPTKNYCINHL